MSSEEIAALTASQMRQKVETRELSPVDIAEACLEQLDKHNDEINAVVTVSDLFLEQARLAEQAVADNADLGPLHGIPVGIKDVTPVGGVRTTFGSPMYSDNVPDQDAIVVRRLREAGAMILGKTNTPEFAAGGNTFNEVFGRTRNPWNTDLSAGGSTGGGAAGLATGMIALAEGTDLGGSLRIPASFCGVVGMRPTAGLVPTYPSEFVWDIYQVSGGLARTAEDLAMMLQAVHGPSEECPVYQPHRDRDFIGAVSEGDASELTVAYCPDICGIGIETDIEARCREAAFGLKQRGASVEEIELDLSYGREAFLPIRGLWMVVQHYKHLDKLDQLGENVSGNVNAGLDTTTVDLARAEHARAKMWSTFRELFATYDYVLTPCMAVPPFPVEQNYPTTIAGEEMNTYIDWIAPTFVLSLSGLPVGSVPCGLDDQNLPVGMQIVGPPRGEEAVLALAKQIHEDHPVGFPPGLGLN